jgi:transposase
MKKVARHWIGVDLHKSVAQVCVLDAKEMSLEERRFRLEAPGGERDLLQYLRSYRQTGRVAVEALGVNRWFVNACRRARISVVVADPVKLNLKMSGKKTDRRDARELARRLYLGDIERNAVTYYPSDEEYGIRKALRTRHRLVEIRQGLVNQTKALFNAYRMAGPKSRWYGPRNLAYLRGCTMPTAEMTECVQALTQCLEAVQASIERLDAVLERVCEREEVAPIRGIGQVGSQTATTVVFELGDLARFRGSRTAASYAGLVPRVAQSADTAHHGRLTKRGNRELRFVLGQWAVRLLAKDPTAQRWAAPRLRRMHKNKVRVALARRLLVGLYVCQRRGQPFDLQRCLGT